MLDGKTLGDIYPGKIKKWDDEAIAKLNPGLKLPSQNIAVVRRADGSGTSFVFTSYPGESERRVEKQRWYWLYRKMADRSGR